MKNIKKLIFTFFVSLFFFVPFVSQAVCEDWCVRTTLLQNCVAPCHWLNGKCVSVRGCVGKPVSECTPLFGCAWNTTTQDNTDPAPASQVVKIENPLGTVTSPQILIGRIINSVLGIVGSLALLMFIYGGLTWMTSGGSADKIKKGRDIIIWSAIGLVVIFTSYGLVRFLLLNI